MAPGSQASNASGSEDENQDAHHFFMKLGQDLNVFIRDTVGKAMEEEDAELPPIVESAVTAAQQRYDECQRPVTIGVMGMQGQGKSRFLNSVAVDPRVLPPGHVEKLYFNAPLPSSSGATAVTELPTVLEYAPADERACVRLLSAADETLLEVQSPFPAGDWRSIGWFVEWQLDDLPAVRDQYADSNERNKYYLVLRFPWAFGRGVRLVDFPGLRQEKLSSAAVVAQVPRLDAACWLGNRVMVLPEFEIVDRLGAFNVPKGSDMPIVVSLAARTRPGDPGLDDAVAAFRESVDSAVVKRSVLAHIVSRSRRVEILHELSTGCTVRPLGTRVLEDISTPPPEHHDEVVRLLELPDLCVRARRRRWETFCLQAWQVLYRLRVSYVARPAVGDEDKVKRKKDSENLAKKHATSRALSLRPFDDDDVMAEIVADSFIEKDSTAIAVLAYSVAEYFSMAARHFLEDLGKAVKLVRTKVFKSKDEGAEADAGFVEGLVLKWYTERLGIEEKHGYMPSDEDDKTIGSMVQRIFHDEERRVHDSLKTSGNSDELEADGEVLNGSRRVLGRVSTEVIGDWISRLRNVVELALIQYSSDFDSESGSQGENRKDIGEMVTAEISNLMPRLSRMKKKEAGSDAAAAVMLTMKNHLSHASVPNEKLLTKQIAEKKPQSKKSNSVTVAEAGAAIRRAGPLDGNDLFDAAVATSTADDDLFPAVHIEWEEPLDDGDDESGMDDGMGVPTDDDDDDDGGGGDSNNTVRRLRPRRLGGKAEAEAAAARPGQAAAAKVTFHIPEIVRGIVSDARHAGIDQLFGVADVNPRSGVPAMVHLPVLLFAKLGYANGEQEGLDVPDLHDGAEGRAAEAAKRSAAAVVDAFRVRAPDAVRALVLLVAEPREVPWLRRAAVEAKGRGELEGVSLVLVRAPAANTRPEYLLDAGKLLCERLGLDFVWQVAGLELATFREVLPKYSTSASTTWTRSLAIVQTTMMRLFRAGAEDAAAAAFDAAAGANGVGFEAGITSAYYQHPALKRVLTASNRAALTRCLSKREDWREETVLLAFDVARAVAEHRCSCEGDDDGDDRPENGPAGLPCDVEDPDHFKNFKQACAGIADALRPAVSVTSAWTVSSRAHLRQLFSAFPHRTVTTVKGGPHTCVLHRLHAESGDRYSESSAAPVTSGPGGAARRTKRGVYEALHEAQKLAHKRWAKGRSEAVRQLQVLTTSSSVVYPKVPKKRGPRKATSPQKKKRHRSK